MKNIQRILILNRAEIAFRIVKTIKRLGLHSIVFYSDADPESLGTLHADESHRLGPAALSGSYLNQDRILELAKQVGVQAVHPGYGLLSENSDFARRVIGAGMVWIGPTPECMDKLSGKAEAKAIAKLAGVPTLPGYAGAQDTKSLLEAAKRLGFPLLIKAVAGGGGRGIRLVEHEKDFLNSCELAKAEALSAFGNGELLLEKYLPQAHHIEVQVFGDSFGNVVHLGERDCSAQRRRQKLIEESPSPALNEKLREQITASAVQLTKSAGYSNAGTVEFLLSPTGEFYFLEVNTRLQVEHPVTEMCTGLDLVEWQLRVAAGEKLPLTQNQIRFGGHSIEARLYAEDSYDSFKPQTGRIEAFTFPENLRVDHFLTSRTEITPYYDAMLAKLIVHAESRELARQNLISALESSLISGLITNDDYLLKILRSDFFIDGQTYTSTLDLQTDLVKPELTESEIEKFAGVAALGLYLRSSRHFAEGAWGRPSIFFLQAKSKFKCIVQIEGRIARVQTPNAKFEFKNAELLGPRMTFSFEDQHHSAIFHSWEDGHIEVQIAGRSFVWTDLTTASSQANAASNPNHILAKMAGTVTRVMVNPGDSVAKGQVMIIVEAMKMQIEMVAPREGRVESVLVSSGAQVKNQQLLIQFEPNP